MSAGRVGLEHAQRLIAEGAQLVEVLPAAEYEEEHLPGALSLPLSELPSQARQRLDPERPVLVYCYDSECDLSPRAAAHLRRLGFTRVFDLVGGKVSWLAAALPTEPQDGHEVRLGALADTALRRCAPDDPWSPVRSELGAAEVAYVVDGDDVLLGVASRDEPDLDVPVAIVMHPAPSTFRPHVGAGEMAAYLDQHPLPRVLVTRADGTLLGAVDPELVRTAAQPGGSQSRGMPRVPPRIRRQPVSPRS